MLKPLDNLPRGNGVSVATLLGLIRSERARQNAPAVLARREKQNLKATVSSKPVRWLRSFRSHCGEILRNANHISGFPKLPRGKVVLPGYGHKYEEVARALIKAGLDPQHLVILPHYLNRWPISRILRWIPSVVQALGYRIRLSRRLDVRSKPYTDVLCRFLCARSMLQKLPEAYWVVIGDLSTQLIATSAAVASIQHRLISWQFDFLDFKPFPAPADLAVVLNETGVVLSRVNENKVDSGAIFWRPIFDIQPLREDIEELPIGVLLNAFADEAVLRRLEGLQKRLQQPFLIRLHPNSSLWGKPLADGCRIADHRQSLDEFVAQVGYVICGNTSAQLKAVCMGTPVIQLTGLDDLRFDHHGYVQRGIVNGCSDDQELNLDLVKSFYKSGRYLDQLRQLLGPPNCDRTQGLEKLVKTIANAN